MSCLSIVKAQTGIKPAGPTLSAAHNARLVSRTFVVFLLVVASGCGTIYQHQNGDAHLYSGVRLDGVAICHVGEPGAMLAFLLDLPLSALADTILLPYDLARGVSE